MRGGTENIPAIAGFKKAVEILIDEMESDINIIKNSVTSCSKVLRASTTSL